MKDNPLISIYMPTWNRQQLAIRAIKSVLRQDYNNWEMIIVDDCSTSWNNYNSTSPPSTIRVSLTFTTTLTAGRARYVTRRLCWRKGNISPGSMMMMNGPPTV